jgi:hypothetical protein
MCSREPLREHQIDPLEGFRPEHDAAQDQERSSHGAREQDPRDAGDDQQGTDLLGDGPTVGGLSGAGHGYNGRRRLTNAISRVSVDFRCAQIPSSRGASCESTRTNSSRRYDGISTVRPVSRVAGQNANPEPTTRLLKVALIKRMLQSRKTRLSSPARTFDERRPCRRRTIGPRRV